MHYVHPRLHSTLPLRLTKTPAVAEVSTFVYFTYYDDKDEVIPAIGLQVCLHPDLEKSANVIILMLSIFLVHILCYHLSFIIYVIIFRVLSFMLSFDVFIVHGQQMLLFLCYHIPLYIVCVIIYVII